jgi:hypothetical protein
MGRRGSCEGEDTVEGVGAALRKLPGPLHALLLALRQGYCVPYNTAASELHMGGCFAGSRGWQVAR